MRLKSYFALALLTLLIAFVAAPSMAMAVEPTPDTVKLKDGRELHGTIVKEKDGYIWLDLGVGNPMFLSPDKIEEIIRESDTPIPTEVTKDSDDGKDQAWERVPGVTRAAVITAEGLVGMQMAAKPLHEAVQLLKDEGVDLVVFKVNSGGGYLIEIQQISDVLENEFKPNFRTIAWIDSAISAAAMSTLTLDNIYFMPRGNFGAATGWSGQLVAVKGRALEDVFYKMEKISRRGHHPKEIILAMQHNRPLSYDIDEATGEAKFYQNLSGEHILNDGTDILTFNSQSALACGFSAGTAGTLEELTALLEPSIGEIEWVGEKVSGVPYPVCKAEQHQLDWRKEVDYQEKRFQEVRAKYMMEISNAQSVDVASRGGFLRRAEGYLARIKQMVKINPNFGLFQAPKEWILQQEELIRNLRRR